LTCNVSGVISRGVLSARFSSGLMAALPRIF
jgi:hypothetical protein